MGDTPFENSHWIKVDNLKVVNLIYSAEAKHDHAQLNLMV